MRTALLARDYIGLFGDIEPTAHSLALSQQGSSSLFGWGQQFATKNLVEVANRVCASTDWRQRSACEN